MPCRREILRVISTKRRSAHLKSDVIIFSFLLNWVVATNLDLHITTLLHTDPFAGDWEIFFNNPYLEIQVMHLQMPVEQYMQRSSCWINGTSYVWHTSICFPHSFELLSLGWHNKRGLNRMELWGECSLVVKHKVPDEKEGCIENHGQGKQTFHSSTLPREQYHVQPYELIYSSVLNIEILIRAHYSCSLVEPRTLPHLQ